MVGHPRVVHEHDRLQRTDVGIDLPVRQAQGTRERGAAIRHPLEVPDQPFGVAHRPAAAAAVELLGAALDAAGVGFAGHGHDVVPVDARHRIGERRRSRVIGRDVGHFGDVPVAAGLPARPGEAAADEQRDQEHREPAPYVLRGASAARLRRDGCRISESGWLHGHVAVTPVRGRA